MSPKHPFLPPRDPGPSTPTPGAVQEEIETWRRWYPIGEPGAPCVACTPALEPGTENRPRHPHPPFPSGMLILVQEFPELPRVPRPSQPWRVTSAAGHLVVITHRGRGLWWAQPVQPPQALGGWSLSSEGAQLLLALISCGDFLTVLETPRRLRLWELCWFGKDGLPLPPTGATSPQTLRGPYLQNAGPMWGAGRGGQGSDISAAQRPTDCTNLNNSFPLLEPQFPHLGIGENSSICFTGSLRMRCSIHYPGLDSRKYQHTGATPATTMPML